jgi:hypothetical protein
LFSGKADHFKVLFSIYDITKAYSVQHVWIPNIITYLKYDDQKEQEILNLTLYLKNEWLIEYKYLGPGIVITNEGIKEVEEAVLHPNTATLHFPINIVKNILIEEQLIEFIHNVRKARRDFLQKLYRATNGQQTQRVETSEFATETGLDEFMLKRVHWYLLEEGLIDTPFSGITTITHQGILEIESNVDSDTSSNSAFWSSQYPDITLVDDLIEKLKP